MERSRFLKCFCVCLAVSAPWTAVPVLAQDYVPGRLLVAPKIGVSASAVSGLFVRHGIRIQRRSAAAGPVLVQVDEASAGQAAEWLRETGLFRYVERDYYARTGRTPDDNLFRSQWYLNVIQAETAWETTTGAGGVTVAVIDSGVDAGHPDLAGRLVPGRNFLKENEDTSDTLGHGTAVAGVLGAASNNAEGVAGVTWMNSIMPLTVVDSDDRASYSDIVAAIRYAADQGARVINISLGGTARSEAMQEAVDYAWAKGSLIFAAAMNEAITRPFYPGACDHVTAVSATDPLGGLAQFSNYGPWVTLSAPGTMILSTVRGGGYGYWNGTSFASPVVAGVAALVISIDPELTPAEVLDLLRSTADDAGSPGRDMFYGWGRVNAARAVEAAQATVKMAEAPPTETEQQVEPAVPQPDGPPELSATAPRY